MSSADIVPVEEDSMPSLAHFTLNDSSKTKDVAVAAEIARRIKYYKCAYDCGARVSLTDTNHLQSCIKRPKEFACIFKNDDDGQGCIWKGTAFDLISNHVKHHKRNVVVLQNCNDFMIQLIENEPIKLLFLYDFSYIKNEIYWMRQFKMDEHDFIIIEHVASVFNGELIEDITLTSFWLTYMDSPNHGNIGRIVDLALSDKERRKLAVSLTPLSNQKSPLMVQFIRNPKIPQNIVTLLECPICTNVMNSNIIQCQTGHSLCWKCSELVTECPTCKGNMTSSRNFALEQLWSEYNNICKFRKDGCMDEIKLEKLKEHEKHCWFRTVICPACHWRGPWPMFEFHQHCDRKYVFLGQIHSVEFLKIENDSQTTCFYSQAYKSSFLITITHTDSVLYVHVSYTTVDTRNIFHYSLKLFNGETSTTFTGKCTALLTDQICSNDNMILNTNYFDNAEKEFVKFDMIFDVYSEVAK